MSKKKNEPEKFKKKDLKDLKKQLKGTQKLEDLAFNFYDKILDANMLLESMVDSGKASTAEDFALIILLDEIMTLGEKISKNFKPEKKKGKKNKKGGKKK